MGANSTYDQDATVNPADYHSKHEPKECPRCGRMFVCKVGDIPNCQCMQVDLTRADHEYIARHYDGCLCVQCLATLAQERRRHVTAEAHAQELVLQGRKEEMKS